MKSLQEFAQGEATYLPNEAVRQQLANVKLVCIVGGVGVGKNYLMHRTGLPIVGRVTSRAKRPDDDPSVYTYYTNTEFAGMIERHELVQYAVDLRNSVFYGSMLQNYAPDVPNLADIWHWSVTQLPDKGFQSLRSVSIITPVTQWQKQLVKRFKGRDDAFRRARLAEAKESLLWTKEQISTKNPQHAIIINNEQMTSTSVQRLRDFADGSVLELPPNAVQIIDDMLNFLDRTA